MKSSYFVAALAVLAAGSAVAQSSVTVYGRLNVTAERFRAANQTTYLLNDNASRLGFRGVEDLGGGMKASFTIEHRFRPDTGASTGGTANFWAGESWVGLEGGFGKVRLGNMGATAAYYATADYISMHNHDTGTSSDYLYQYVGGGMQNTVAYTSPSFGGLTLEAQLGLSEATQAGRTYVLAANYDAGPLHIGAGYVQAGAGVPGPDVKQFGIRGLYELGDLTLGAYYIRDDDTWGNNTKRDSARVSAAYAIGAGEIHGNLGWSGQIKNNGVPNDDAYQFTVGYNHNLSKRTKVYTYYTRLNDETGAYGGKFGSLAVGVRHNF